MGFDLASIFGKGIQEAVTSIGNIADKFIQTKSEKDEFNAKVQETLQNAGQKELESYLADTKDARDANVKIQESDKASWLSKNVAYIIDLVLLLVWSTITLYLVGKAINVITDNANMTAVLSIYATVTAIFGTSLNFHRGASKGGEKANDFIRNMNK